MSSHWLALCVVLGSLCLNSSVCDGRGRRYVFEPLKQYGSGTGLTSGKPLPSGGKPVGNAPPRGNPNAGGGGGGVGGVGTPGGSGGNLGGGRVPPGNPGGNKPSGPRVPGPGGSVPGNFPRPHQPRPPVGVPQRPSPGSGFNFPIRNRRDDGKCQPVLVDADAARR